MLVNLNYIYFFLDGMNIFEVYEKLILDCFCGDVIYFFYWDEVLLLWNFIDYIVDVWINMKDYFLNYKFGLMGFKEVDDFI